jgi:transcriptional regulator with XRE-family HTH domain
MSLDELASRTKLSKSFLSQVERGTTSPSIESLSVIAEAIQVPMFLFFVEDDSQQVIRRRDERRTLTVPDSHFQYESIWFGANRKLELIIGRLKPGESSSDRPRSHWAPDMTVVDECVFVLHGKAEFHLGDDVQVLEEGDSAYFAGHIPHLFCALGDQELVLLFAIAPPAVSR